MHPLRLTFLLALLILMPAPAAAGDGNRLAYLDELNLYYPSRNFPRLVTPQWVGEDGVEAVIVLAIDDMRGHQKWEAFLRPVLQRLKRIDGRAPVSIMTCKIDPKEPHLQKWLKEGLSLETHTVDHPCPILRDANLERAKRTFDRCVDMLAAVPNSRPVAFRTPCCDSLNTVSPRFFAEIFNKKTPKGNFLTLDSSVFNVTTPNDPALPRKLVLEADGSPRFAKYLPQDRTFVNTIEDYPYPYVIGRLCWEFPCAMPSDWAAQHLHGPNNPKTVSDWKALLDATVIKQGVFNLVFHPHGWISNEQVVDFIDYAAKKYGKRVKFLTFRECQERLTKNLLGGQPLRDPETGEDNGVRLLDVDNDGYMDVVIGNEKVRQTRLWSPKKRTWITSEFPRLIVGKLPWQDKAKAPDVPVDFNSHFGVLRSDGNASFLSSVRRRWQRTALPQGWHFDGRRWIADRDTARVLSFSVEEEKKVSLWLGDRGARLRDLDGDGICELIIGNSAKNTVFAWDPNKQRWRLLPFALPAGAVIVDNEGRDAGLRFIDLEGNGHSDIVFSNEKNYGIYLFTDMKKGWSRKVMAGKAGDKDALSLISRNGTDNGCWVHSHGLWWQNENTSHLKDLVDRRSFAALLKDVEPTAKSPQASLRCLKARPGFRVELVASEPLVRDPIAFAWGPDGKLWVVEMGDYPLGVDGKGKPGGRIKFLESTKHNGIYDKATVFLDNLPFPTGVLPWRKGVLVTCAPDIFYAEDTDGDGKADKKVVLYTGFVEGNQQHRVNTLAWGLDNWIYVANGDSGGRIKSLKTGKIVNISGRDLRIRPDTGDLDTVTGGTQYGRSRDDWGNWFGGNNSNPMWHYVLADRYLRRNPFAAPPPVRIPVSIRPGAAPVFPISRTLPRFNDPGAANHFTSACSPIVYRDELFENPGADAPGSPVSCFVSEPVHNLVHREIMSAKGVTFSSRRAADEQRSEFLASSDNWFRPTTIRIGPDGALWVADMYRAVIEHPQWIPRDWQKRLDLRAGHDKGRIYRVFPVGKKPRAIPRLDKLDTAGLVAALDSPSGYQRDLVQQMLLWRQDKSAIPLLEKLARKSKRPLARLHALCTLDGLGALTPALLRSALADAHPGVRRHAVRLCEARLARAPELGTALLKLVGDADAQVRMQLACTLGEWDDARAGLALGELAVRDRDDRYLSAAVLSSINKKNLDRVLQGVLKSDRGAAPPAQVVSRLLLLATAMGQRQVMATLLAAVAAPEKGSYAPWQYAALAGLLDSLDQRNTSLAQLADSGDPETKAALAKLAGLFSAARAAVADPKAPLLVRVQAVPLLARGLDRRPQDVKLLGGLLVPQVPPELRAAAISTLGRLRQPQVPALLLRGWGGYGPQLRSQVLDVLFRRGDWQRALLAAVEKKQVRPAEVDAARRQRLLQHRDAAVRRRAEKAFAGAVDRDRQKIVESYRSVARLKGDMPRGMAIFKKTCAICHKLGDVGKEVGPDLASLADKSTDALLVAILDPNRAVEARYVNYIAETKNGLTLSGVLTSETGNSITLVGPDGKEHVILRANLESLTSTGKSAMPEGIEKELKSQDLADLIAFLRSTRSPAKP